MNKTVLIIDDKKNTLKVISAILADEGYSTLQAANAQEALDLLAGKDRIDVILSDLKMPGMDGLELFYHLKGRHIEIPFIVMTAHGSVPSAVEAMKNGIANYLIKPLNYDELSIVVARAIRDNEISAELADLRRAVHEKYATRNIVGSHPAMQRVLEMIETVAPTNAPVLIQGEIGTGKELLAGAIHAASQRQSRPLISINCAALPGDQLEVELFGTHQGTGPGTTVTRKGRLESADGGTLFLDEIGQMDLPLQTKLLRFLQKGHFDALDAVTTIPADIRIIAATHLDLGEEVKAKRFLEDLLYRIEVCTINLPPLRQRGDDLGLLINRFLDKFSAEYAKPIRGAQPAVLECLAHYPWPGNVRELENCIARAVILAKDQVIAIEDLPNKIVAHQQARVTTNAQEPSRFPEAGMSLKEMEAQLIGKTLGHCKGNKSQAAKMLGLSRKTLYEKIALHQIASPETTDMPQKKGRIALCQKAIRPHDLVLKPCSIGVVVLHLRVIGFLPHQFQGVFALQNVFGAAVIAGNGIANGEVVLDGDIFEAHLAFEVLDPIVLLRDLDHSCCPRRIP